MKPIEFPEQNMIFAEYQAQYLSLPACKLHGNEGLVISCWQLTWWERIKVLFTGKLWMSNFTFNQALQPQLPTIDKPEELTTKYRWENYD